MFAALSRVFPPHPASGITSAAASANPIISFLLFILPSLLVRTASLESSPPKTGTIPASVGSRRTTLRGKQTRSLILQWAIACQDTHSLPEPLTTHELP